MPLFLMSIFPMSLQGTTPKTHQLNTPQAVGFKEVGHYKNFWHRIPFASTTQKMVFLDTKRGMSSTIEKIIGIPRPFLLGIAMLSDASIVQHMFWASNRVTKRKEDIAYCLLVIF